ncbi:MAG: TMEM175 family protein [Bacteroidia bacterium]
MIREEIRKHHRQDPRITYRGENPSRLDNLTDSVFGIAITLLIFNLANPNSFADLLLFTKTLPAFLISISFLVVIWNEHLWFSEVYGLEDTLLAILNTLFIALIIFYVYPLRFLTLFLTNFFFGTNIEVNIMFDEVPNLMIYYGLVAFALYFTMYLLYARAYKIREKLAFNDFEAFYTLTQKNEWPSCLRYAVFLCDYRNDSAVFIYSCICGRRSCLLPLHPGDYCLGA